jgi:hypothetical protein
MSTELVAPKVASGVATYLGVGLTIVSAAGTTYAAIKSNDTATVVAGVSTITTALTTIGGRVAQAVALIRQGAALARPVIDALAEEQPADTA